MSKAFFFTFIFSLALAALGFVSNLKFGFGNLYALAIGGLWLILFVIALIAFRRQALWFLLGAPIALGLPLLMLLYLYECMPKSCL